MLSTSLYHHFYPNLKSQYENPNYMYITWAFCSSTVSFSNKLIISTYAIDNFDKNEQLNYFEQEDIW